MQNAAKSVAGHNADRHEGEMRARGLRKITLWVPETNTAEFEAEYRREMAVLSDHYRTTNCDEILEPDAEDVKGWT